MSLEHISIFSGDTITARRIKNLLEDHNIHSILKEDKIIGYEISNNSAQIFVLNVDEPKAKKILNELEI